MTWENMPLRVKMLILRRYWKGENLSTLAKRYRLSRSTIYRWHRQAMAAVRAALTSGPGKPPKK